MSTLFEWIKIIAIVQVILIFLLLLFAYAVKIYAHYKNAQLKRVSAIIETIILAKDGFQAARLSKYKKYVSIFINLIHKLDHKKSIKEWPNIRSAIITLILLPKVEKLACSKQWTNRNLACQILELPKSYPIPFESIIKKLINDAIPLIAINASCLAFHSDSQTLLDEVIDSFAKGRRIQQSLYAQILPKANESIIPLIKNRLQREEDPYIKAFCYRTLSLLPNTSKVIDTAMVDLDSTNLELTLSVMNYLAHYGFKSSSVFHHLLTSPRWEVRARAAKWIGETQDEASITGLAECLKDSEWWVRINAAEALAKLGEKGIAMLKKQNPNEDRFAYDAALQVLSIMDIANGT